MKTHQLSIGRLYFFAGSRRFKTQYATTGSPLRGSGMILDSHTDLEVVGCERVCSGKKSMNGKRKRSQWSKVGSGAKEA